MKVIKVTKNRHFYIYLLIIILIVIPASILAVKLYSNSILNYIYRSNSEYVSILSKHECAAIEQTIYECFNQLKNIAKRLSFTKINSEEELYDYLSIESKSSPFNHFFLLGEDNSVLDFHNHPNEIIELIKFNFYKNDQFIVNAKASVSPFNNGELLLTGTKISMINIAGKNYIGLCSISRIEPIKTKFNNIFGNSKSSQQIKFLCQTDGNFLIKPDKNPYTNYFEILKNANSLNFSYDEILNKINKKENFFITYNFEQKHIQSRIQSIQNSNLFMIVISDLDDYQEKAMDLLKLTTGFAVALISILILFLIVTLIVTNNIAEIKAESKTKEQFLSTMSHEIRTPLNGIIGLVHLMQNSMEEPERLNYYFKKTSKTSNYLLQLINNILDISKFENGKIQLADNPFFLKDMIESIVSIHKDNMTSKGINFEVTQNIFCSAIFGDEIRIQQIIMNLIGNAYKFTPEGGTIKFIIEQENTFETDEISTIFTVQDTGCGISKEFQNHLFEAFSQERNKMKVSQKGTGLGLAISYMLANQMNGKLEVQSEVGKGSSFTFTLPSKIASTKQVNQYISETTVTKTDKEHNILIAEDNELNAEILSEVFAEQKIKHRIAYDGKQVIEIFAESEIDEFDVILMDIQMPYYNGYEATQIIRKMKREDSETVKIIACSANTFEEDKERAKKSGMNGFIVKPINVKHLLDILGN